jgi:hypothetical protein
MGVGDLIGKYVVIAIGCLFYFFSITTLIDMRGTSIFYYIFYYYHVATKAEVQTFFRSVDKNSDGLISKKEYANYKPCEEYSDTRVLREFMSMGKRITLKDVQSRFTPKISNLSKLIHLI